MGSTRTGPDPWASDARRLGGAAGEDHLVGLAASGRGDLGPRPLDDARARRAPRHGPRTGCRRRRAPRPSPPAPRGAAARWRSSRGRRGGPSFVDHVEQDRHGRARGQLVRHHVAEAGLVQEHVDMGAEALPQAVRHRLRLGPRRPRRGRRRPIPSRSPTRRRRRGSRRRGSSTPGAPAGSRRRARARCPPGRPGAA